MLRRRFLPWIAVLALCFLPLLAAQAQSASPPPAGTPTVEQLQQLVSTLKDDKARAQLIDQLQALIAAQNAEQPPNGPASPKAWFTGLPGQLDTIGGEILAAAPILAQAPSIGAWAEHQFEDPALRQRWIDICSKLFVILAAGLAADLITRFLLRHPARFLHARQSESVPLQLTLLTIGMIVELLPVLAFAAVA
ncbi:MAG TPA: hypothetical protein VHY80_12800, partial [Stellaceae bacterium]|nr:hypothetical protein [Stellaceae bacterium]